jgi:CsoR family transcriptional regulator, copper-sensing transcriptional repressor
MCHTKRSCGKSTTQFKDEMMEAKPLTNSVRPHERETLHTVENNPQHEGHSHDRETPGKPHVHDEASLRQIVNRLSRIEGHIRGIKTMVTESRPCPEVLIQIAAVRGALDRVARLILDEHLSECVVRATREGNIDEEIEQLKAALDRFLP